uniref:Uncharacterized protein n=1 Tax=Romanomermis culicivorax TaxID=13658 RepID=A0A915JKX1_ROMCU
MVYMRLAKQMCARKESDLKDQLATLKTCPDQNNVEADKMNQKLCENESIVECCNKGRYFIVADEARDVANKIILKKSMQLVSQLNV